MGSIGIRISFLPVGLPSSWQNDLPYTKWDWLDTECKQSFKGTGSVYLIQNHHEIYRYKDEEQVQNWNPLPMNHLPLSLPITLQGIGGHSLLLTNNPEFLWCFACPKTNPPMKKVWTGLWSQCFPEKNWVQWMGGAGKHGRQGGCRRDWLGE